MPHPIRMKNFEGHLGIKWSTEKKFDDIVSHIIRQPHCFFKKTSNIFFSEMTEQIEMKLYTYDCLSMMNKRFTHMMSQVTCFGSHTAYTLKPLKIHHSKEVSVRVCNLRLLFFLFNLFVSGKDLTMSSGRVGPKSRNMAKFQIPFSPKLAALL